MADARQSASAVEPTGFPHQPVLDGLRACAFLLVFFAHAGWDGLVPGGFGVTIFFFLSGYLITSLLRVELAQTGRIHLGHFYLRRVYRIFPPLYLTLLLCLLAIALGALPVALTPGAVALQALHLSNYALPYVAAHGIPAMPVWSLAVEEHFYLGFPLLYWVLARNCSVPVQTWVLAGLCAISLGFRLYYAATLPDFSGNYAWTHTRLDALLAGCLLAIAANPVLDPGRFAPRLRSALAAASVLLLCLIWRDPWFRETWRYTLQEAALFVLFSWLLGPQAGWAAWLLQRPWLRRIGQYSYTLYLAHFFMLTLLSTHAVQMPQSLRAVLGFALSFAYAALMYRLVEQRMARQRRRLHRGA